MLDADKTDIRCERHHITQEDFTPQHAVISGGECGTPDPDFIENDIEILKCMMMEFIEN